MKKIHLFLIAVVALIAAACSPASEADGIARKISKGDALSQSEYTAIIDYCGDYAKKAQTIQQQIDNLSSDSPELSKLNAELESVKKAYPLTGEFFKALANATPEEVGEQNVKKVDEYSAMIWFDAPSWASEELDPKAAGLIEDVAPAAADSAIIAAPALQETEVSK